MEASMKTVLTIDQQEFVLPHGANVAAVIKALSGAVRVEERIAALRRRRRAWYYLHLRAGAARGRPNTDQSGQATGAADDTAAQASATNNQQPSTHNECQD
jgi:hypothetical protein